MTQLEKWKDHDDFILPVAQDESFPNLVTPDRNSNNEYAKNDKQEIN